MLVLKRSNGFRVVTHLGDRSSKNDDFVELTDPLHELINARSFDNVDVVILTLNLDRYRKIGLVEYLGNLATDK